MSNSDEGVPVAPAENTAKWWTSSRVVTAVAAGVVLLVVVVLVAVSQAQTRRAENVKVDQLYCTLSGISPNDEGPKTGRLCADLLANE